MCKEQRPERGMQPSLATKPTSARGAPLRERLQVLLDENMEFMRELRSSTVCSESISSLRSGTATAEADLAHDNSAVNEGAEELARMRGELAAANERAATIAECTRRQSDIHTTLLRAAHTEAVASRDEAVAEARVLRQQVEGMAAELSACQTQLSILQRTKDAELAIVATQ
jgi:plasmid stabilization system protein ParE